jgi:hypothetical protein
LNFVLPNSDRSAFAALSHALLRDNRAILTWPALQSAHLDIAGIAIGLTQAQNILSAMSGSAASASKRRHRPESRKERD